MRQNTSRLSPLLILVLLLLQTGCATKIPSSLPLAEGEKSIVFDQLKDFQNQRCSQSIDADVTLEWQLYGKTEKIPGMLQLNSPAFFRYTVVDPLGRQLFILVSNGNSFTLVDNRKAEAMTGPVDSDFWQKNIPGFVLPEDYMSWLTGRLPAETFDIKDIRQDKISDEAVWLVTDWKNNIRHHVLFYSEIGQVKRHIVEGGRGKILLDVSYTNYGSHDQFCPNPLLVEIEGAEIKGTVKVHFDQIFPDKPVPQSVFYLTLPEHYNVRIAE